MVATYHHFSFGSYRHPQRDRFGDLWVVNDDRIEPDKGFPLHPHKNMEIITLVHQGTITHTDNQGNHGHIQPGELQVMSAGNGIMHSEYNHGTIMAHMYQIWIKPDRLNITPRWETRKIPPNITASPLSLLVSGMPEHASQDVAFIYADAAIYGGMVKAEVTFEQQIKHQAYVILQQGKVVVNGQQMNQGDGAEISQTKTLSIAANQDSNIFVIDIPNRVT